MNSVVQGYPRGPACARLTQAGRGRWVTRVQSARRSKLRQHAGENLQSQVFLVAQSVCSALDDTNLIVESFHESERDFVLWPAVGGDSIPVPFDHCSEFLVGFEALPLQACPPVLEEAPCPALALVLPELTDGPRPATGLPEQVRRIQSLVRREHLLERLSALQREVLATREQRVLLALDVAAVLAAESAVLGLAHLVERISQVAHDVKLVKQDRRLRRTRHGRVAKRLPHVHHRQANAPGLLLSQPVVELQHARLLAVLPPEPDRAPSNQIAHHDAVRVALADRDLVDADGLGSWRARADELRAHVLLLQGLHRFPVQLEFLGNILDGGLTTAPPHVVGKALGIEGIVRQEVEPLALHAPATLALHAAHLDLQKDARVATRQIAKAPRASVVPARVHSTAATADRFFERRLRVMTRAFESPNTPRTVGSGRNPRNAYASQSRRRRFVELAIQT